MYRASTGSATPLRPGVNIGQMTMAAQRQTAYYSQAPDTSFGGRMVLRIYFTAEDLVRTTVTASADPLWEVLLSGFRLHEQDKPPDFRLWLHHLQADPDRTARIKPGIHLLSALAPRGPYIPDFLTPDDARVGLAAGLEAVLSTPRRRLRRELRRLAQHARLPDWVRPIAEGDVAALSMLADALGSYHEAAIACHHEVIQASVDADRVRRARCLLDDGVAGLFGSLHPLAHWRPPVLAVDYPVNQELHLRGRGLRLVPSFFCGRLPISLADPDLAPVLVYPIDQDCRWTRIINSIGHRSLDALLGTTRAAVLRSLDIDVGMTTTQLARHLHTSSASASRHASVLRDAGLITTHRHGAAVLHTLTP